MQRKRKPPSKKHASFRTYTPQSQLSLPGFEPSFIKELDKKNRWVQLSRKIPWDQLVCIYNLHHPPKSTGRPSLSPRILIGSVMIKHLNDYDDRETIEQIRENLYLQYFLGLEGFTTEAPFDASVFVNIRKKLTPSLLQSINERLYEMNQQDLLPKSVSAVDQKDSEPKEKASDSSGQAGTSVKNEDSCEPVKTSTVKEAKLEVTPTLTHKGELLMDASVAPQGIAYPTDLNLLNDARMMSEHIIDNLYVQIKKARRNLVIELEFAEHPDTIFASSLTLELETSRLRGRIMNLKSIKKPRTYRQLARKDYLQVAQNKKPGKKKLRKAIGKQLRYLRRNFKHIENLLNRFDTERFPLDHLLQRYYWIIQLLYAQQMEMFTEHKHRVDNRIVSIHQPHVRPIVRGKAKANTEFGAKIHLSLIDGYSFLDTISWDAFNEGTQLQDYVENYKERFGYYPAKVLVDKIYCTRENRKWLKDKQIKLAAKPLGRPSAKAVENHVSPGERNPIEGKFGQAKLAYGMNRIRAKLQHTSESWIASIILVLNLVRLTRQALYCLIIAGFSNGAMSIWAIFVLKTEKENGTLNYARI